MAPASDALGDILAYLTTIVTRPLALDDVQVPGCRLLGLLHKSLRDAPPTKPPPRPRQEKRAG